jgi:Nucleotidyl transferase AbiEii toxin, Type IV TA system
MATFVPSMLTFQEFAMQEPLPLATIQQAVLDFLQNRDDVAVFGAQAVNAYVAEPRMTQDIDLLSTRATAFTEELRQYLAQRFHIAVCTREVAEGRGLRLFQVRKTGNRHLVDIRAIERLPDTQRISHVLVIAPADLIATKVIALHQRRGKPKSGTDWRDIAMLLLTFPELKQEHGLVAERLEMANAASEVFAVWHDLVRQEMQAADDDEY